ncbi:MAG TPA: hypothetical protein VMJ34_23200 [Bryobacteraceae bacterium]|nr:hypothetical protein [Bryobacteraceae bacterium]
MKWKPEGLGAEPKKVAMLTGLGLLLAYLAWSNLFHSSSSAEATAPRRGLMPYSNVAPEPTTTATGAGDATETMVRRRASAGSLEDFKPSMKKARQIAKDPARVDPTLRLDLLARLQSAKFDGSMRSVFEFTQAPPPPVKEPKPIHPGPLGYGKPFGPPPVQPPKPAPPTPPPPIPLKFYGYVNPARPDIKSAFFLENEDILVASEGQTVSNRYRIVRIGVNSAVVEDLQHKNQQTLPLIAEENGG